MERDEILSVNGKKAYTFQHIVDAEKSGKPATLIVKRDGVEKTFTLTARKPLSPEKLKDTPKFGILPGGDPNLVKSTILYPTPTEQIKQSA
ncbi:MAG TPA: hypothetical protein DEP88_08600, partial [Verrucomicrobiales bacterium]|nr:hypothetical protein [Verrucomicrobiales bacterium]